MTTGVDAKTCRLVVLDRTINSMTEFKQIIGRGTRIDEEHGKLWFTILDFKKATELFADPAFDGDPVVVFEPEPDAPITPPEDESESPGIDGQAGDPLPSGGDERVRYVVDEVPVYVVNERVQYLGPDGKLIIESLRDFTRIQIGKRFVSLDAFLQAWSEADRKRVIIEELEEHGVLFDELAREVGKELDPFDLICHIAFGQKPLTRRERAERVKKRDVFGKYSDTARKVLQALLDKYADAGIENIEQPEVLKLTPLDQLGSPVEIIGAFGGRAQYQAALRELERALYQ
ncbi:EcoEI R domain-containing protein [Burkholderia pseudomallei]|nr:EcoEI R domain-containing protein [Burkholderia pseudomallei]CAJ9689869.1 EcoEI R domain-containing protein [Burkholderia pseudomallei]VBL69847.1 EcoEI R domain-containing protein [Burkholderia pseudomallei]